MATSQKETSATIDRIEGDWAIVEQGSRSFKLPLSMLPAGCGDGCALRISIQADAVGTAKKQSTIAELQKDLLKRG